MASSRHSFSGQPWFTGALSLLKRLGRGRDDMVAETIRSLFDPVYYLAQNKDVARKGADPLRHYCTHGWREGRDPNVNFSTRHYLMDHPDVAASGMNPFYHYIVAGHAEGRAAVPAGSEFVSDPALPPDARAIATAFDATFYLSRNEDVAEAGLDPLLHYCGQGWREGRDPAPDFSTRYYLESNPDVAQSGMNPFHHYVIAGRSEGRAPTHPGGYKVEILRQQIPLEETVARWRRKDDPGSLPDVGELAKRLAGALEGKTRLMVSIGHDQYRQISGGVQLSIQREERLALGEGCAYLNLHPWSPLPRLAHPDQDDDPVLALVLDGEEFGLSRSSTFADTLRRLRGDFSEINMIVHHMMGHSPERLADIINAGSDGSCWLWLHDFFTICPSFALQRNNVTFCGAPPPESNACSLCLFGKERINHLRRIQAFLKSVNPRFIAPSEAMREMWSSAMPQPAPPVTVLPHVELSFRPRESDPPEEPDYITIAFVGTPVPYKGWPTFEKLCRAMHEDERYRFVYFGRNAPALGGLRHISVAVTADQPDAMVEALAEERVDLVLHWAACFETFSLSTYEAMAAGAGVITNPGSGNVAMAVMATGRGRVLQDEAALPDFFSGEAAAELVQELRERRSAEIGTQHPGRLTLALLEKKDG